jgi:hypothetical protein
MNRNFTNKDAAFHLRYGIGCVLEGTFAIWLLIHAESYRPVGIWIAYFLLTLTAACLLAGFFGIFVGHTSETRRFGTWPVSFH